MSNKAPKTTRPSKQSDTSNGSNGSHGSREPHPTANVAPYGSWKSPITAQMITGEVVRLGEVALDGADTYWLESRPREGGRSVLVRRTTDGKTSDLTPPDFNVRTRVHEYGGAAYVVANGQIYFSNFADNRLYAQTPQSAPHPITPAGSMRYADLQLDPTRNRIVCVREDHSPQQGQAINTIVGVRLHGGRSGSVLVSGNDFYAAPRISPDGSKLAWLTWNHPNMPWDGCELWVGDLRADGAVGRKHQIAGGSEESIFQPEWAPDGTLYFVSDRTNWWNLYRWQGDTVEAVHPMEAEFGTPHWAFGFSTYAFTSASQLVCTYNVRGEWRLALLDTQSGKLAQLALPYTDESSVRATSERVVFIGASATAADAIVEYDLTSRKATALRESTTLRLDEAYISRPEVIEFATEDGKTAYGIFYRPRHPEYAAPKGERPPLIVRSHGGPTSAFHAVLNPSTQYWTSRGFAVLDVNYGGSTGYGREYRQRLNGQWGVVDVDDCINGAKHLSQKGEVDVDRLIITGGSAGGYTTLAALAFRDAFKAGSCHFGLSELTVFITDTHKFESRYLEGLIGPYPERADLYHERSPLDSVDRIDVPLILFQGLDDKVVPPSQSQLIANTLRRKGLPVAYIAYEGEGHGFRRAENIQRTMETELDFYGRVFGFTPADKVEPAPIENMLGAKTSATKATTKATTGGTKGKSSK